MDFSLSYCLFNFAEQKKQKVSEIKSGLDEAETLVLYGYYSLYDDISIVIFVNFCVVFV